jgi:hypothetical protein
MSVLIMESDTYDEHILCGYSINLQYLIEYMLVFKFYGYYKPETLFTFKHTLLLRSILLLLIHRSFINANSRLKHNLVCQYIILIVISVSLI